MYLLGILGLLVGCVLAQTWPSIPREKLVAYEAVVVLRDYKPGADPSPYAEALRQHLLRKEFQPYLYEVQLQEVAGERVKLRLYAVHDTSPNDIQKFLIASGAEVLSLTPSKPETSVQTR
ncbi:MAG: hypothetical protein ABDH91_06730 [Bacteroidia bacterium]